MQVRLCCYAPSVARCNRRGQRVSEWQKRVVVAQVRLENAVRLLSGLIYRSALGLLRLVVWGLLLPADRDAGQMVNDRWWSRRLTWERAGPTPANLVTIEPCAPRGPTALRMTRIPVVINGEPATAH